jgi:periplasmic protein TonB
MTRTLVILGVLLIVLHSVAAQKAPSPPPWLDPSKTALYSPRSEYPESARARGLEGSGMFILRLRRDGTVRSVEPLKSTGHSVLDKSAIAAFRQWRFPRSVAHETAYVKVPITFTMHGAHY